jgi:hypothetical protein
MKKILLLFSICAIGGIIYLAFWQSKKSPVKIGDKIEKTAGLKTRQKPKTSNQTELTSNAIVLTNLPEHIQFMVQFYWMSDWNAISKLTPADKTILLRLYRQEPTLARKKQIIIALGLIGDEEVVDVFKQALSDEYAGRKLTAGRDENDEELVMNTTVSVMGFLANKSDTAYELLKKGVDPKFWKDYCKFIPANDPRFYGTLAGDAIKAIGRSGRPDVTNFLESLKPLPLVNDLDKSIMRMSFVGAVFDSAFANAMITQRGVDYYKFLYFNLDNRLQVMAEWQKQGIGLEWDKWYQKKNME